MGLRTWLRDRPSLLEWVYQIMYASFYFFEPVIRWLGIKRTERLILPVEKFSKEAIFDCRMCGQCILHSTGMVCPMTCPKNLRNGACGGVLTNGHCEVKPEMKCVWVAAYERAKELRVYGPEIITIKPPVNHQLAGSSAWINMLTGEDKVEPKGWATLPHNPVIVKKL